MLSSQTDWRLIWHAKDHSSFVVAAARPLVAIAAAKIAIPSPFAPISAFPLHLL